MKILVKPIIRQVSKCIIQKFNRFPIVRMEYDQKLRHKFSSINIIYEPVKSQFEKSQLLFF